MQCAICLIIDLWSSLGLEKMSWLPRRSGCRAPTAAELQTAAMFRFSLLGCKAGRPVSILTVRLGLLHQMLSSTFAFHTPPPFVCFFSLLFFFNSSGSTLAARYPFFRPPIGLAQISFFSSLFSFSSLSLRLSLSSLRFSLSLPLASRFFVLPLYLCLPLVVPFELSFSRFLHFLTLYLPPPVLSSLTHA